MSPVHARLFWGITAAVIGATLVLGSHEAWAQAGAFGVGRPPAPAPAADGGFTAWLLAKQAEFYRSFSGLIRAARADGSALWALLGISFLYGVFHAAGPGHGKAVISSYVVANRETWRRGIVLSFASAMLQAVVAVLIVGIGAALLGATSRALCRTAGNIEVVSYALIAAVGAWLLLVKGRGLIQALGTLRPKPVALGADVTVHRRHTHAHDHAHHDNCGHAHGPDPQDLAGPGGWRRGLSAIVAVGLRPCSGAIVVLVFALAQGLFWAGVAATFVMALGTAITVAAIATLAVGTRSLAARFAAGGNGYGIVALRAVEVGAAALVLALGALLLAGYLATERLAFC